MKQITVYHVSPEFFGDEFILTPRIPHNTIPGEDEFTRRICCCLSPVDCIRAIDSIPFEICKNGLNTLYLYKATVGIEYIYMPDVHEVPDVWMHHEVWLKSPTVFTHCRTYSCSLQFKLPNNPYARYQFVDIESDDVIVDRMFAPQVYGDEEAFSMLMEYFPEEKEKEGIYNYYYQNRVLF